MKHSRKNPWIRLSIFAVGLIIGVSASCGLWKKGSDDSDHNSNTQSAPISFLEADNDSPINIKSHLKNPLERFRRTLMGVPSELGRGVGKLFKADEEKYEYMTLKNGMKVLLISNKHYTKSAASLAVRVGSSQDPKNRLGLAHFLEHMLFISSQKYPELDSFMKFFGNNGGFTNAYTAPEQTNYFFLVDDKAFSEGLDRLADMVGNPTFDPQYIQKEINAVESEYARARDNDIWRKWELIKSISGRNHPLNQFSVGSKDTFAGIQKSEFVDFYNKYYVANEMSLVLVSNKPLRSLRTMANRYFSNIRSGESPSKDLSPYGSIDTDQLPLILHFKPLQVKSSLELIFTAPETFSVVNTKPQEILTYVLGYEGEKSLIASLKDKGFITNASPWSQSFQEISKFGVEFGLTAHGLENTDQIIAEFFAFIRKLKNQDFPVELFEDAQKKAQLGYDFREAVSADATANYFADALIFSDDPANVVKEAYLLQEWDQKVYEAHLNSIKPEAMLAIISNPNAQTNQKEPLFGAEYRVENIGSERLERFKRAEISADIVGYPGIGRYFPKDLEVYTDLELNVPAQLTKDLSKEIWIKRDSRFFIPKTILAIDLIDETLFQDQMHYVKAKLYAQVLNQAMFRKFFDAYAAGIEFSIGASRTQISIKISGYSSELAKFSKNLMEEIKKYRPTQLEIDRVLDNWRDGYENEKYAEADTQSKEEIKDILYPKLENDKILYDTDKNIDLLAGIKASDLEFFVQNMFLKKGYAKAYVYGNLNKKMAQGLLNGVFGTLKFEPNSIDFREKIRVKSIPQGQRVYLHQNLTTNHAMSDLVEVGYHNLRNRAMSRIFQQVVGEDFFKELRTKQQLGYAVYATSFIRKSYIGQAFIIMSQHSFPENSYQAVQNWKKAMLQRIKAMPWDVFANIRFSAAKGFRDLPETMDDDFGRFVTLSDIRDGNFNYYNELAKEVDSISKEEFEAFAASILDSAKSKSLAVFSYKEGQKPVENIDGAIIIKDKKAFSKSLPIMKKK